MVILFTLQSLSPADTAWLQRELPGKFFLDGLDRENQTLNATLDLTPDELLRLLNLVYSDMTSTKKFPLKIDGIRHYRLSNQTRNCLNKAGIHTIGDLIGWDPRSLMSIPAFGEHALEEVQGLLTSMGLHLGMTLDISTDSDSVKPALERQQNIESPSCELSELDRKLYSSIAETNLTVAACKFLKRNNFTFIGDLVKETPRSLFDMQGLNKKVFAEISLLLDDMGLSLGMRSENFPDMEIIRRLQK